MKIKLTNFYKVLVFTGIALTFFSSACLWNEQNLSNYILCSLIVMGISVLSYVIRPIPLRKILNNRYIVWIILTYLIFEIYGLCFLRIGEFNWDFILVSGILQICLTILLMSIQDDEEVVGLFCSSCAVTVVVVCLYMIQKGSIRLSNVTFGSSFGLELSGNRNTVATIIGIMIIPVAYLMMKANKTKLLLAAVLILSTGCMLLTGSKKGIIVILLIMIMIFFADRKAIKYLIFPFILIISIYAVFNIPVLYNVVGFRLRDMFATLGFGTSVTNAQSTYIRNSYILMGLKSMWNHPLFGGGMNYFQYINNARYYSHNNYIELLNNVGIVGTLIYYWPALKRIPSVYNETKIHKNDGNYLKWVFLLFFFISKFALDYAMVSYSTMCVFNIQFLLVFEVLRREKISNAR